MSIRTVAPSARRPHQPSARARVALIACVLGFACALPAASAGARVSAAASGSAAGSGSLSILGANGRSAELLPKLTLPQVASLLETSPTALIAQLEAIVGARPLCLSASGLLEDPIPTVQQVLNCLTASGVEPAVIERALGTLMAPFVGSSERLSAAVAEILEDLASDGDLEELASELGVSLETLKSISLTPVTSETVARTLNTTIDHLGAALQTAGAASEGLAPTTPLVSARVISPEGGVQVVGLPGSGGPTLTTVYSSTAPTSAGVLGFKSSAVSNAFKIVSIKVDKSGRIVETVKLANPGRVSVSGSAKSKASSRKGSRTRGGGVVPASRNLAAGTRTITLRPRNKLGRGKLTVSLVTLYRPTGGSLAVKHKSVTIRRPSSR